MLRLVTFAIRIDDVRDIFGAEPGLADRLRQVAATRLIGQAPQPKRRWFKPMLRDDPDTQVRTDRPLRGDVDALLAGGFIAPDRLPYCWRVLTVWLEELSAAHAEVPWDVEALNRAEWDLARAGLNSDYSLRRLSDRDLGAPLRPLPGHLAGYAKAVHVAETLVALREALADEEMTRETAVLVAPILDVLTVAAERGLDVVVVSVA